MTWQFGILADRAGHVHLGAVVAAGNDRAGEYVELLEPLSAAHRDEVDLKHLVVLDQDGHLADLRELAERCIDDDRLRRRLIELIDLSAAPARRAAWAA
jgi:hypothetical protein